MMDFKQFLKLSMSIVILISCIFVSQISAWIGMPTPPLHVEGNELRDPAGNHVVLHGWMQPMASWFNGRGNMYSDPSDWTDSDDMAGFLDYMYEVADLMSDTTPRYGRDHGWYATFSRLNTDNIGGWSHADGLYDMEQFDGWIENFIIPYANYLQSRGIYLVLSAVGPINTPNNGTNNAGVVEGERLRTFWSRVAAHPGVQSADNIMFELMNEPVNIESSPGNGDWGNGRSVYFEAFRDWMQPVIDDIRNTGSDNIIWVSTLDWQGSPHQWVEYPFEGENIGIACHLYPAYGGAFDDTERLEGLWNRQYKPAADRWPMIITEMFWTPFPDDPWNLVNGTTEGFGNTVKSLMDNQGNVSYMIGFFDDLIDDAEDYRPMDAPLSVREGSQAYFSWQPQYRAINRSQSHRAVPGRIQFETFERMSGVRIGSNQNSLAERHLGYINPGDWAKFLIDVREQGTYSLKFRFATGVDENSDIIIKNQTGTTIGTFTVDASQTDGWNDWYIDSVVVDLTQGEQELTFEFEGSSFYLFNLDWFELTPATTSIKVFREFETEGFIVRSAPNPIRENVKILIDSQFSNNNLRVEIFNINGWKVFESKVGQSGTIEINDTSNWNRGLHYIVLYSGNEKVTVKSMFKIN